MGGLSPCEGSSPVLLVSSPSSPRRLFPIPIPLPYGRESHINRSKLLARERARLEEPVGLAPALLARLGVETFHGPPPLGGGFGHFTQLGCSKKPAGLHVDLGVPLRGGFSANIVAMVFGRAPHQTVQQFAQPCANEMVFQPRFFKPGAGSGEV